MKKIASIALITLIGMTSTAAFAQLIDKEQAESTPVSIESNGSQQAVNNGTQQTENNNQKSTDGQQSTTADKYPQDHLTEKDNTK